MGLFGYDPDGNTLTDSARVVFEAGESKGLGAFGLTEAGTSCDPDADPDGTAFDEGRNP